MGEAYNWVVSICLKCLVRLFFSIAKMPKCSCDPYCLEDPTGDPGFICCEDICKQEVFKAACHQGNCSEAHGKWETWSDWSVCNCNGYQFRQRSCIKEDWGDECQGNANQTQQCQLVPWVQRLCQDSKQLTHTERKIQQIQDLNDHNEKVVLYTSIAIGLVAFISVVILLIVFFKYRKISKRLNGLLHTQIDQVEENQLGRHINQPEPEYMSIHSESMVGVHNPAFNPVYLDRFEEASVAADSIQLPRVPYLQRSMAQTAPPSIADTNSIHGTTLLHRRSSSDSGVSENNETDYSRDGPISTISGNPLRHPYDPSDVASEFNRTNSIYSINTVT